MAYKKLKLWFDKELAESLSDKIIAIDPGFSKKEFIQRIESEVDNLELKPRVECIADCLNEYLKGTYPEKVKCLMQILGPENEEETGMFLNYYWIMPIAKFVEKYGLNHFNISIKAIAEVTKRNTGEYAIRPFIRTYPKETMSVLLNWATNENKHIRRLASEGPRPRLPWATKLQPFIDDPTPLLPILDTLKDDPSKYVQKSVANCINDILKDNEEIAKALIDQWLPQTTKSRKWIIKHATRNLRKQKDHWALSLAQVL